MKKQRDFKPKSLARADSIDSPDRRYKAYKKQAKEADSQTIFDFAADRSIYKDTIDSHTRKEAPLLSDQV